MTVKVQDILAARPMLTRLTQSSFTGKKAFVIARLLRQIQNEMETYDNSRESIIQKYANRDENGELIVSEEGMIHVAPEKIADCNVELIELAMTEINLDSNLIPFEWLEEIEMTPEEAMAIEAFVEM